MKSVNQCVSQSVFICNNQSPKKCIFHDFGLFYLLLSERDTRLYCIFFWHDLFCAVPHRFAYHGFIDSSVALRPCLTRCRQNVGCTKTSIKDMEKKRRIHLRRCNSLQDCESGLSLFTSKGNRTLLTTR